MINPAALLKLKGHFSTFRDNHPKALLFLSTFAGRIDEGSVVEMSIKLSDGTESKTNIKVNSQDLEMIDEIRKVLGK